MAEQSYTLTDEDVEFLADLLSECKANAHKSINRANASTVAKRAAKFTLHQLDTVAENLGIDLSAEDDEDEEGDDE